MVVGPDFGTAVVLVVTAAALFFVAGLDIENIWLIGAWRRPARGRRRRVRSHIAWRASWATSIPTSRSDRYDQPQRSDQGIRQRLACRARPRYQPKQSRIAVGSGGAFGVGLMQGKQKLLYLPEAHTDFIYAVVGEELGLLGNHRGSGRILHHPVARHAPVLVAPDHFRPLSRAGSHRLHFRAGADEYERRARHRPVRKVFRCR